MSLSFLETMNEVKEKSSERTNEEQITRKVRKRSPDLESPNVKKKKISLTSKVETEEKKEPANAEESIDNAILVAKHYNSLQGGEISHRNKSRILHLRNFNNWIKTMLILEYINRIRYKAYGNSINVLDMCCGKGGDLFKWRKINITHLICTDLAEIAMQQCQDRYKEMLKKSPRGIYSTEFITADCTKVRIRKEFKDPSILLDLVSCQFAFHYGFESLPQAECLLKNASECLKPEGYFIGTIPDAYSLVSRWQNSDGNTIGNELYNVEFFCDKTNPPLFGAKYHFQLEGVVNCPEFLVYLPIFRKLGLKFGLKLVLFERFDDFYERMKGDGMGNLSKMQALETYSPRHKESLVGKSEKDYEHVKEYIQNSSTRRDIGTLSQPEWEVITLYAVFAFQKIKT